MLILSCLGGCDGCLYIDEEEDDSSDDNLDFDSEDSSDPNSEKPGKVLELTNGKIAKFTSNHGLRGLARALEKVYTTVDWPFKEPSLSISLQQSGL